MHAEDGGLVRVRIDLAYDGTGYSGWARQPDQATIQGALETALVRVLRLDGPVATTCAGRTDAGVHARGQVCHVDLARATLLEAVPARSREGWDATLVRRLNAVLDRQVRVHRVREVAPDFDARFSATWRRYAYRVCDHPEAADPLRRTEVLAHSRALDLEAMNAGAEPLLGEHDFAAYCRWREGATTVRRLRQLRWERDGDGLAVARVVANAFCHNMVRSVVGALLAVGEGRREPAWPGVVLAAGVRDPAVQVAAAHGLTLEEVGYPA